MSKALSSEPPHEHHLVRTLGLGDVVMIGIAGMIGGAIFVLVGPAIGLAGSAVIIAFIINGIITLFTAMAYTDPNALKSIGGGGSGEAVPFTSPEDLMKNIPKAMSNMFGTGAGGGMLGDSPTFKITMKEYEDMAIKVGDKIRIEIEKAENSGV